MARRVMACAVGVAAAGLAGTALAGAEPMVTPYFSDPVQALNNSASCSQAGGASAGLRAAVDLLHDSWLTAAGAQGLSQVALAGTQAAASDPVTQHPTTVDLGTAGLTMDVSLRNVPLDEVPPYGGVPGGTGVGQLASVNSNGPSIKVSSARTLQDCAPYPASHYGASAADQTPAWTEVAGDSSSLNGVLFQFASPVRAFGAFFGDLESRPGTGGNGGAGTPAWFKVFGVDGSLLSEGEVPIPEGAGATDAECGGVSGADGLGCGNGSTRWLGWIADASEPISAVLVTVGDDDSCDQVGATQCTGTSEHLSWVGASVAVDGSGNPNPTTTTSTTGIETTSTVGSATSTSTPAVATSTSSPGSATTVGAATTRGPVATAITSDPAPSAADSPGSSAPTTGVLGTGVGRTSTAPTGGAVNPVAGERPLTTARPLSSAGRQGGGGALAVTGSTALQLVLAGVALLGMGVLVRRHGNGQR
ncbi:MAG: hypothetical protein R2754_04490 [Microthrixaceae bacterium]